MAGVVAMYEMATGYVTGVWWKTTSDNISTAESDGHLSVDSVHVIEGLPADCSAIGFVAIANPTDNDTTCMCGVLEVDDVETPTDMTFRTDENRNQGYMVNNEFEPPP